MVLIKIRLNIGLYIHIPFCRRKCDYCSFYSVPIDGINSDCKNDIIDKYLEALVMEIDLRMDELQYFEVDTIYFGGGTPSLLSLSQLDKILNQINKRLSISGCDEITIECNPDNFSISLLEQYKILGINRFVLGVQTLNEKSHTIIGRAGSICDVKTLHDFAHISDIIHCIDIIFGIPGQTWEMLYSDLKRMISFKFDHISAYTLTIESGTPIAARKNHLPDIDNDYRALFESTIDYLQDHGYVHYEVSNYALPGYESKHNQKYWKFLPYAGFGAGAHSFYHDKRYYNQCSIEEYIKNNGNIRQKDTRTKNSRIVEYILSGMRLIDGISLMDFQNKLGINVPQKLMDAFIDMKDNRLLLIEEREGDTQISFSRDGFFQMDNLIYKMIEMYL